jgi:hypothetical protein
MMRLSGSDPDGLCDGERTGDSTDKRNGDAVLGEHGRAASTIIAVRGDFLVSGKVHQFRDPAVGFVLDAFKILGGVEGRIKNIYPNLLIIGGGRAKPCIDYIFESGKPEQAARGHAIEAG